MKALVKFREKYSYINEKTLQTASINDPVLLRCLLNDKISSSTIEVIIKCLEFNKQPNDENILMAYALSHFPNIRVACYYSLSNYLNDNVYHFLKYCQKTESNPRVQYILEEIMEKMTNFDNES